MGKIIQEERKLSRKFSGIADILEKKMEAGFLTFIILRYSFRFIFFILVEKKSHMDREQMEKSGKKDGSTFEEQAFLFNLF